MSAQTSPRPEPPGHPAPRPAQARTPREEGPARRALHAVAPWADLFFKLSAGIAAAIAVARALI